MSIFDKTDAKFVGLNIVLAVFVGLSILVGLVLYLRTYTEHGVEVEVTDVRGLVEAEARPLLDAQGLHLSIIDSTYTNKVPLGTIVDQDPKPNSHAKHGRAVYVTINATTKRQVTMPNLQDMSYRQAEATLRGLGIRVDSTYEYRPSTFRDLVLDVKQNGVSVQPGDKIPEGSRVRLVVGFGQGTEQVEVPSVVGLPIQDARRVLLAKRLIVGGVYYDEPEEEGVSSFVYRQEPAAGETRIEGETVTLYLSKDVDKAVHASFSHDSEEEWF